MANEFTISYKAINKLAIPAVIGGIAEPILSSTDTAIVGNIPIVGTESLAAVGIVGAFLSMLIWVLAQTRSSISSIISQYFGAGKLSQVSTLPSQTIFFNIILGLMLLAFTLPFSEEIFTYMGAKDIVLENALVYYKIRVWGIPLTLFTFVIFGIFRGLQNTFWPMIIALIGMIVNVGLDFALVYGIKGYINPMGINGAAWASLFSQLIMAILSFYLLATKTQISLKISTVIHPDMRKLVVMSLNLFVRAGALNLGLILAVKVASSYGNIYIAAHTIAIQIWLFTSFFIDGYASAANILGGKFLGAMDFFNLKILVRKTIYQGLWISLFLMIIGFIFYNQLGKLFSSDELVLNVFYDFFYIVLFTLPLCSLAFVLDGLFKGFGEMKYLRNVLLVSTFIVFIPLLFLTKYFNLNLVGIWIAFVFWIGTRGAMLFFQYKIKYSLVRN